jgi:hypothetical protein
MHANMETDRHAYIHLDMSDIYDIPGCQLRRWCLGCKIGQQEQPFDKQLPVIPVVARWAP